LAQRALSWRFAPEGLPIYVMPLVFGGAPIVNVLVTMLIHPPKSPINPMLYVGFALASIGGCARSIFQADSLKKEIIMMNSKFLAVLLVMLASVVHAENWPSLRGPGATGVSSESGLPITWSETENIAWKAKFRGVGVSSPIVWGDRVFVTSQLGSGVSQPGPRLFQGGDAAAAGERALNGPAADSGGTSFLVTAFDRVNGKQLWEYEMQSEGALPPVHEKHNLASPSPVTDGERVYAWFGTGQFVALDMNGKPVWQRNLVKEYGKMDIQWGTGSSPIVYKDTVILQSYHPASAYLLALDSRTGKDRWKIDGKRGAFSYSTPYVVEAAGVSELIVNWNEGITAHDPSNGRELWHIPEINRFPIPMAFHHKGITYLSRGYRSGPYYAIQPGGKVIWKVDTGAPYISSLVYYDDLLYMMGDVGVASVVDAKTGERVWQERLGGVYSASPVAADGKVYFLSESGETIVLAAGRTPRVLARNKLNARQLANLAISGGRLFIRSDDTLFAIGK
jgi:outer membrane protein assembly factor BamB